MQSQRKRLLVRTFGFTAVNACVYQNRLAWLLNVATVHIVEEFRSKFVNRGEVLSMDVIDLGAVVWPRSVGHQPIWGNIAVHYGLVARTLFVQMLSNKLKEEETDGGGKSVNV